MKILKKVLSVVLVGIGLFFAYPFVKDPHIVNGIFLVLALMFVFVGFLNFIGKDDIERKFIKIPEKEKLEEIIFAGKRKFLLKYTLIAFVEYVVLLVLIFPLISLFDSFEYLEVLKYSALSCAILTPLFVIAYVRYFIYLWELYKTEYEKMN